MADIAEKLHISVVTVSKAMAGKEGVGDELREKILAVANEMGYEVKKDKKNSAELAKAGTDNIGIVVPSRFMDRAASFYANMYNALSKELLAHGYYAVIEQLENTAEERLELPQIIKNGKVDGVIFLGQVSQAYAKFITGTHSPFMFLDFYSDDENVDSVTTDNFYGEYVLTKHLIDLGHRDIRYVGTFGVTTSINDRFMGFLKAMLEHNLSTSVADIIDDRDKNGVYKPIVLPKNIPTAFVCNCDEVAVTLIRTLHERGLRVPDDVSVVGFDDFVTSTQMSSKLTTVAVDFEAMARSAVDIIIKKIAGLAYNTGRTVICCKPAYRESTRKIS